MRALSNKTTRTTTTVQPRARKAPTRPAPAKPARAPRYPFPFFGAGRAEYFEWGDLYVWFEKPPPRSARAALKRAIPEPFRGDVAWAGPVLYPGNGDQFINLHICNAYASLGDDDDDDDDDDDSRWGPLPNNKQSRAFEADIVQWLHDLHRKHPIAFVARRHDWEAGGTKLDAWHRWSLGRFADVVLPRVEAHLRKRIGDLADGALREAVGLVLDSPRAAEVPAAVRRWHASTRD
jgi:hypothetical protein